MTAPAVIWVVLQDVSLIEPVLGVFGDMAEADAYADFIRPQFPDGAVLLTSYTLPWTHDGGAMPYTSP